MYWARRWLGTWVLVSGIGAIAVTGVEWLVARGRRTVADSSTHTRVAFLVLSALIVAAHLLLLAGVPWSSLEWTDGFSLRYALPCWALLVIAGYATVVSLLSRPHGYESVVGAGVAVLAIAWYASHQTAPACHPTRDWPC